MSRIFLTSSQLWGGKAGEEQPEDLTAAAEVGAFVDPDVGFGGGEEGGVGEAGEAGECGELHFGRFGGRNAQRLFVSGG